MEAFDPFESVSPLSVQLFQWTPEDGGALRMFLEDGSGGHIDVVPELDRVVVFQSTWVEHEG